MSIGLPFTWILLDAGKLEFQERWSGLEVAAVGNSSSEVLTRLIDDRILGSELALPDGFGPCPPCDAFGLKVAHLAPHPVPSKIVVFATSAAQFLRNEPSAPGDKSTARSAL